MALTPEQAIAHAREIHEQREAERRRLDEVRRYWMGRQKLPAVIPSASPDEVRLLARMSRVNVIGIVVESLAQSLAVEGFRAEREADNVDVWDVWQRNKLDARQSIIHRSVLAYGVAYSVVTPGRPVPVVRGLSPRRLTTLYESSDADWPAFALEWRARKAWRLYDADAVYELTGEGGTFEFESVATHNAGATPVVRYLEIQDPDWDDEPLTEAYVGAYAQDRQVIGQVAPLMTIQDQIDLITFNLLVAQHYAAFRQRFVIGWLAPDEQTRMKMGASTWLTFEDSPDQVKVGDLEATPLDGYLKSRESSFRQGASLSQTPAHELIGELVNLSAEALAAAEAGRDRKVADRQTTIGESHEQTLILAGRMAGIAVPEDAQVVWRDTSARSFAATIDGLGKAATMLGIPADELWERIPGVSQQDVVRWRKRAQDRAAAAAGITVPTATNGKVPVPA
jgi:hypothetical protein